MSVGFFPESIKNFSFRVISNKEELHLHNNKLNISMYIIKFKYFN